MFELGTAILDARRLIVLVGVFGAAIALSAVLVRGPQFTATATFVAQSGGESELSALRSLAGQFGVPIGGSSAGPSPEFYAALATSSAILEPIARDSIVVDRDGAATALSVAELLVDSDEGPQRRLERTVVRLRRIVRTSNDRRTGIITVHVRSRWREVSVGIAARVLENLNDFNLRSMQRRASDERRFAESRVVDARTTLRAAEDELQSFLERNRLYRESPQLAFSVERLQRAVSLQQQILVSLEQVHESARLREVRDVPVITVLQPAGALSVPDPRGRVTYTLAGAIVGVLFGAFFVVARFLFGRRTAAGDAHAIRFYAALSDVRRELGAWMPWRSRGADRGR